MTYYILPAIYILALVTFKLIATMPSKHTHIATALPKSQDTQDEVFLLTPIATYTVIDSVPTTVYTYTAKVTHHVSPFSRKEPVSEVTASPVDYGALSYDELKAIAKSRNIKCKGRRYIIDHLATKG